MQSTGLAADVQSTLIRSREKALCIVTDLGTERLHPKPQYRKCSPQPQNPNPQRQKSVAFHT